MNTLRTILLDAAFGLLAIHTSFAASNTVYFPGPVWFADDESSAVITVQRSGDTNSIVSVDYSTVDGTAKAGIDYVATSGTLTFALAESSKTFSITVLDNGRVDGNRTVALRLSNPLGAILSADSVRPPLATLTILDNESPVMVDTSFRASIDGFVAAALVQADGRIIVAGRFSKVDGINRCGIARLKADGSLDESFDARCTLRIERIREPSLHIQADGKILVSGIRIETLPGGGEAGYGLTVRLHPNGTVDDSFKPDREIGGQIFPQPDGTWIVFDGNVYRLNPDGTWKATIGLELPDCLNRPLCFAQQADGKFLIGGETSCPDVTKRTGIARFHADGLLDTTFQTMIGMSADWHSQLPDVRMIFVQSNGQIIIGGQFQMVNGVPRNMVARLNSDGSLDPSFNAETPRCCYPIGGALQADGKVLMSFYLGFPASPLQRYHVDGSTDSTFSSGGFRVLALQPDGKLIVDGPIRLFAEPQNVTLFEFEPYVPVAVAASGRTVEIQVRRLGETINPATVDFATHDGTARAGMDYVATSGTLTFAPLETRKSVVVSMLENRDLRTENSFSVLLKKPSGGGIVGLQDGATATVIPQQTLTIESVNFAPGGTIRLTLSPTVPRISYRVQGLSDARFTFYQTPADYFYQDKIAMSDSLEFEEPAGIRYPRRFYRAIRLGYQR